MRAFEELERDVSTRTIGISDELYDYLLSVSVPPDTLWERLRVETSEAVGFNMQISPEQGQLMSLLVKMLGAKNALEVGTFTGYSALCVARALPADGRLIACDVSEEWTAIARRYWEEAGVADKIDLRIGPALATLDAMVDGGQSGSFDFAFIDADKENYAGYYERCLALLRPGGVVGVDNTLWSGAVADPDNQSDETLAIRALNRLVYEDDRVDSCVLPIGDGLSLALKR